MTELKLDDVLEAAARLQEVVPDAALVGAPAAASHARRGPMSVDHHDPVLGDLRDRFSWVLEAIEQTDGWVTNRVVPGKIILGELGDIEAGVRQMIRRRPLEVSEVELPSGNSVRVPTLDEILRVKAFLIVRRNQTRDYLDVAALATRAGLAHAAGVLARIDAYYADQRSGGDGVASQVARQLAQPQPADTRTTRELAHYKRLDARWHDWKAVTATCASVAERMVLSPDDPS